MQKARRHNLHKCRSSDRLLAYGFRFFSLPFSGSFSPFLHSTSSLSVFQSYLAFPDGAGKFRQGSSDPALIRILTTSISIRLQDSHLLWSVFPNRSALKIVANISPLTLERFLLQVWANSLSLATTYEITVVFFSSRYLDVSVPRVISLIAQSVPTPSGRVSPFGHLRITARVQLPVAYRSLPRPSSALKA
jgi:hypothetical protein